MKKIAVISNIPLTADSHRNALQSIFSQVSVEVVPISEAHGGRIDVDVGLVTAMDIVPYAQKYLNPGAVVVNAAYTLEKRELEEIRALTGPLTVVHEFPRAAMARKTLLQRLGIPPERMRIWCPGLPEEALSDQILRFGNVELPQGRQSAVAVPGRMLSVTTIFEIALGLGIPDITSTPGFTAYFHRVCTQFSPSIDDLSVSEFNAMVGNDVAQRGLLAFTQSNSIFYCDAYVASIVGKSYQELIGRPLYEAFPFLRSCEIHRGNEIQEQLVLHEGKTFAVKLNRVSQSGRETGYLQVSDYWAEEQRQGRLRRQVTGSKSKAKYSFLDMVGVSPKMEECKKIAHRMAYSNSNILITGDTGVGKELFAQSIHNASARRNQPFIAVNCGAIVESLLESELFGYEKGAFTGAAKNGKQGLFELAHNGTLFLDEIGEMPLHLQVRLLRVLQEKEVVRVGGDAVIPVDVRVIAATNKDIPQMIERREFRSDLYYRLNVLPLYIPPLSQRGEDILSLMAYFQQELGALFTLDSEAREALLSYPFPGNIRELRNCVEYLANLGVAEITAADLPTYMREREKSATTRRALPEPERELYARILRAVALINDTGLGAGRRSIHTYLLSRDTRCSEQGIRKALAQLSDWDLVDVGRGRGGVRLTNRGKHLLESGAVPE